MNTALSFEMGARLAEARAAYAEARLPEAEHAVRQVLAAYPNNPEAIYLLGAIAFRAQKYDACVRMMQRTVALQPRNHDAHLTLGMAFRAMRKPREARAALQKAVTLKPSSLDGRYNLALTELEAGDDKAALKNLERAVKAAPNSAHLRNTYAGVLVRVGQRDEALKQLRRAAALDPNNPEMQQNLAAALQADGQQEEAVPFFRRALATVPGQLDATYGLANSLTELRQLDEAYTLYDQFLAQQPTLAAANNNYGLALRRGNRPHDAVEQFRKALEQSHGQPMLAANLAEALVDAGRADEAVTVLRASIENRPTQGATLQLADLLARLGRMPEAGALLDRLLKRHPDNVVALVNLVDLRGRELASEHEQQLRTIADNEQRLPGERTRAHLALGALYDARADFRRAFEHWRIANETRHAHKPFDLGELRAWIDRQIAFFTPDFVRDKSALGVDSEVPVFIVGLPRSGATLFERMLAAHPKGFGLGEVGDLFVASRRLPALAGSERDYPDALRDLNADVARKLAADLVALRQKHAPQAARIADKTPSHWQYVGLARLLLPKAAVVHVSREPMDLLLSIFGHHQADHPYPAELSGLGQYWREHRRLERHWSSLQPMIEVRYEDLVQQPEAAARTFLTAVGLAWDPGVLRLAESKLAVTTASRAAIRQPLSAARIGHWKNYVEFLGPLQEAVAESP